MAALGTNIAVSGFESLTDVLATEQIKNAKIAGALEGEAGNILSQISAADAGARIGARTGSLLSVMRSLNVASCVAVAGATGYSFGARLNAGVRSLAIFF